VARRDLLDNPRRSGKITAIKAGFRHPTPLSPSAGRHNYSPQRPEPEGFTPVKQRPRTPSEQLLEENQQHHQKSDWIALPDESRPSSAHSRQSITLTDILNPASAGV
jgi:hypothetical protein